MRSIVLALGMLLALASAAEAQNPVVPVVPLDSRIADSRAREQAAIDQVSDALRAGRISPTEHRTLDRHFARLLRLRRSVMSDGRASRRERRRLDRREEELDVAVARAVRD